MFTSSTIEWNRVFFRAECQAQVNKFPNPRFKKFPSQEEAESFVRCEGGSGPSVKLVGGAIPNVDKYIDTLVLFLPGFKLFAISPTILQLQTSSRRSVVDQVAVRRIGEETEDLGVLEAAFIPARCADGGFEDSRRIGDRRFPQLRRVAETPHRMQSGDLQSAASAETLRRWGISIKSSRCLSERFCHRFQKGTRTLITRTQIWWENCLD